MKIIKSLPHIFILLLFPFLINAQEKIVIGQKYTIYSNVLGEERAVWVYLPSDYYDTTYAPQKYPVMYLLDGDSHFHSMTGIHQFLSKGVSASVPQMIIVGILNTDRARDLTPTNSYEPEKGERYTFKTSGGNRKFISFLEKELMPVIKKKYRTNGYKLFVGHSFGGLTVLNTLLTRNDLFNAYVAIDPSIWWDNNYILKEAANKLSNNNFEGKTLFLAQAQKRIIEQDTTTEHQKAIMSFKYELDKNPKNGLRWQYKYFEDEDHGSVPLQAEYYGLKYIYEGFQSEIKMVAQYPELLTLAYASISEKLKFELKPSESLIDWLGNYCLNNDRKENAMVFFNLNKELYPESHNVYIRLGDVLKNSGNKEAAISQFQKAIDLKPQSDFAKENLEELRDY